MAIPLETITHTWEDPDGATPNGSVQFVLSGQMDGATEDTTVSTRPIITPLVAGVLAQGLVPNVDDDLSPNGTYYSGDGEHRGRDAGGVPDHGATRRTVRPVDPARAILTRGGPPCPTPRRIPGKRGRLPAIHPQGLQFLAAYLTTPLPTPTLPIDVTGGFTGWGMLGNGPDPSVTNQGPDFQGVGDLRPGGHRAQAHGRPGSVGSADRDAAPAGPDARRQHGGG